MKFGLLGLMVLMSGCFGSDICGGRAECNNVCEEADFIITRDCGFDEAPRPIACDADMEKFSSCVTDFADRSFMVCGYFRDPVAAAESPFALCVNAM